LRFLEEGPVPRRNTATEKNKSTLIMSQPVMWHPTTRLFGQIWVGASDGLVTFMCSITLYVMHLCSVHPASFGFIFWKAHCIKNKPQEARGTVASLREFCVTWMRVGGSESGRLGHIPQRGCLYLWLPGRDRDTF
jgi:hypothetical protein